MARPATLDRPVRRGTQLVGGLLLFGVSIALMVHGGLGVMPWAVLDQGVAHQTGLPLGVAVILSGAVILLCWIPLRERPGIGTVLNVVLIGLAVDATLVVLRSLGEADALPLRVVLTVAGVVLNGVATAAYIGARLGSGPRDGLMTGLVRITGRSVRLVRTTLEVLVVAAGWALGGTVGAGTVLYAATIGLLVHALLPRLTVPGPPVPEDVAAGATGS